MLSFVASHRTKLVPKDLVTAEEIQQAIINRIMRRQYESGDRLPSVRDMAQELGSNRNTVNKAYQMLAEIGVVESLPGGAKASSSKRSRKPGLRENSARISFSRPCGWRGRPSRRV